MRGVSSSNRMVEMFVDTEKICFNPYGKTGLLSVKQRRPVRCNLLILQCRECVLSVSGV